jgi:hypothetical protein
MCVQSFPVLLIGARTCRGRSVSRVARSAIASATRAQRAPLTVIFVPVTGWLARGGRPVSSCSRGHQVLRPAPPAAGCGETARGSRRDAGRPPGGSGDAAVASGSGSPQARAADLGCCAGLPAWCLACCARSATEAVPAGAPKACP